MRGKKNKVCADERCSEMQRSNNSKKCWACGHDNFVRYNRLSTVLSVADGVWKKRKNQRPNVRKHVRKNVRKNVRKKKSDVHKIDVCIKLSDVFEDDSCEYFGMNIQDVMANSDCGNACNANDIESFMNLLDSFTTQNSISACI